MNKNLNTIFSYWLQVFPGGFSVTPSGEVFSVSQTTQNKSELPETPPHDGGFLVVSKAKNQTMDSDLLRKVTMNFRLQNDPIDHSAVGVSNRNKVKNGQ